MKKTQKSEERRGKERKGEREERERRERRQKLFSINPSTFLRAGHSCRPTGENAVDQQLNHFCVILCFPRRQISSDEFILHLRLPRSLCDCVLIYTAPRGPFPPCITLHYITL